MDGSSFDTLARLAATGAPRRTLLRSAVALVGVGLGLTALLGAEETAAQSCKAKCNKAKTKKKKAQCKKKCDQTSDQGLAEGSPCDTDGECRATENLVCDVPFGASNSDTTCCRGTGASCTPGQGGPKCCIGEAGTREFQCVAGTCQPYVQP